MAEITVELPVKTTVMVKDRVLDFYGTLSRDGNLLPGMAGKLMQLAEHVRITVLTTDTFGTAKEALCGLPVDVRIVLSGAGKERFVRELGPERSVAIGNGRNDVGMIRAALFGSAVS